MGTVKFDATATLIVAGTTSPSKEGDSLFAMLVWFAESNIKMIRCLCTLFFIFVGFNILNLSCFNWASVIYRLDMQILD